MKFKVGKSGIEGKGLIVKKPIREGELIGLAHVNDQPTAIVGKFHNHSENPSAASMQIGDKRYIVALRELKPGEEITTDYRQQPELEQPEDFKKGGLVQMPKPSKKGLASKAYSRSLEATNRVFTENKLFEKPKDRKRKVFDPRAKHYEDGGETELPKAQLGKGMTVEVSPFSLNANQTQLASDAFGEYDPEALIGFTTPLGGSRDPRFSSTLGLTTGLPYSGQFVPSVSADWTWKYRPSALTAGSFAPTVQTDFQAGWDPTQGFNGTLEANPRWEFRNYRADRYRGPRWPAGAWRAYVGPQGGINLRQNSFAPTEELQDQTSESKTGNVAINYGANAGFETRPFRSTPLRLGVDASLLVQPGKREAEQAFNPSTDFGKVGWGATPMVNVKAIYPIGAGLPKKDEAKIEKKKAEDLAIFENNNNDSLVSSDSGFPTRNKPTRIPDQEEVVSIPGGFPPFVYGDDIAGPPIGYLPGYEPESGRRVSEVYTKNRYAPELAETYQDGGEYVEMELTPEEIENYRKQGWIIEDID